MIRYFSPSSSISVPAYLPYSTVSPFFTTISSSFVPLPTATTSPFKGFSFAQSGIMIPPSVFSSAAAGLISTLSANGLMFIVVCFLIVNNITFILCFLIARKCLCEYCAKIVIRKKTANFALRTGRQCKYV